MRDNFEMIIRHFPTNEGITIIPVSDVHLGAQECYEKDWDKFCRDLLDSKNTYVVLVGDLVNNGIKSSVTNVYEERMRPKEQKSRMVRNLTPIRERILCAVSGNHEARNLREVDNDITYDIMAKLDLEDIYREDIAFLKLQFGRKESNGLRKPTYTFAITHGNGSSIYTGASATKAERFGMAIDGIDCLVVGHTHKPMNYPVGKIMVDKQNNRVSVVSWRLIVSTSWLGYSSYAARNLLTPTANLKQQIMLAGNKKLLEVVG